MTSTREAKAEIKKLLERDPEVHGIGVTWQNGRECVLVNVARGAKTAIREKIQTNLPETEFVIQEIGDIRTQELAS